MNLVNLTVMQKYNDVIIYIMSIYNDLYQNQAFKPTIINDLDNSWSSLWANTDLIQNSNMLSSMINSNDQSVLYNNTIEPLSNTSFQKIKATFLARNKSLAPIKTPLDTCNITNAQLSSQLKTCNGTNAQLSSSNEELSSQLETCNGTNAQLSSQLETSNGTNAQLSSQLEICRLKVADEITQKNDLQKIITDNTTTLTEVNASIINNTTQINTLNRDARTRIEGLDNLSNEVTDIQTNIPTYINSTVDSGNLAVKKQLLTDKQKLYLSVKAQNDAIEPTIQNTADLYSTDDQKVSYQTTQTNNLKTINTALYYIYFALLVVIGFILVFYHETTNIYSKAFIAGLFIIYPFIINYLESFIYIISTYMWAFINGNVYRNGYWNGSIYTNGQPNVHPSNSYNVPL